MIVRSSFRPLCWLRGPHRQTCWPLLRRHPVPPGRRERLELPDGDFLDLYHVGAGDAPLVLVLHGLEGSLRSHYAGPILQALTARGMAALFMHFRGCSGEPNRLPRSYHSGETGDLAFVLGEMAARGRPVAAAVGYSLGGNVLLKYLGEEGADASLQAAVAVSVPFDLAACARRLDRGLSRIYQWHLLRHLRASFRAKFSRLPCPLEVDVERLRSFWEYDDKVTAPLHGFSGVEEYYERSSCGQYLGGIRTPTLILHARDDPFMYPDSVPGEEALSAAVTLELAAHGGHVGFVAGRHGLPRYWLEERISRWLGDRLIRPT